ncbi:capsular polysaccharide synthesis protein [Hirsutella rhossiliensis]|uniref:Capsular polysaccharide synthesis protein n=1 Tax=Hirsutella rhossiliensis TaxID=111463 RepID=A0A9P8MVA4_9HYPO|nr:capsular polysaccharide synthesis protein [Hirsutella rhossiliensis]KAH0962843.1 capsular polysaccharide synthesis protein [Hirsutella rhossiliensis]
MESSPYPLPGGVSAIPPAQLDLRPDAQVDEALKNPGPVIDDKNIWFFWHSGFARMHPYTQRNVRAWHRRFSKQGWVVRVVDREPSSPLNVANFLDIHDPDTFPQSFVDGTIGGDYAPQHTSDLVRWPLLLKYGGVYADVGLMQIGDLDRVWNMTIGSPDSPFDVLSYNAGGVQGRNLTNYFLAAGRDNPLFARCHKLLLALWAADGGKTSTDGMHASPLLRGVPLMGGDGMAFEEDGKKYGPDEVSRILTDYIIQGQVMSLVMCLVDDEDGWDGPKYVAEHVYAIEFMVGSQLINDMTAWSGARQLELMSLPLPRDGEPASEDQQLARAVVESCLRRSFGFKLAHGLIVRVMGDTLGSLWRKHTGADNVAGTYGHWLRYGMVHWCPTHLSPRLEFTEIAPLKRGPLLRAEGEIAGGGGEPAVFDMLKKT